MPKETFTNEGTPAESQMLSSMIGITPFAAYSQKVGSRLPRSNSQANRHR